jgi:hypothetical protein
MKYEETTFAIIHPVFINFFVLHDNVSSFEVQQPRYLFRHLEKCTFSERFKGGNYGSQTLARFFVPVSEEHLMCRRDLHGYCSCYYL